MISITSRPKGPNPQCLPAIPVSEEAMHNPFAIVHRLNTSPRVGETTAVAAALPHRATICHPLPAPPFQLASAAPGVLPSRAIELKIQSLTQTHPSLRLREDSGDANDKKHPGFASPDFDQVPQLIEQKELTATSSKKRPTREICVARAVRQLTHLLGTRCCTAQSGSAPAGREGHIGTPDAPSSMPGYWTP
jgi:hypothetical protein